MTIPPAQGLASPNISTSELTKTELKKTVLDGYSQGPSTDSTLPILGQQIKTTTAVKKALSSQLVISVPYYSTKVLQVFFSQNYFNKKFATRNL